MNLQEEYVEFDKKKRAAKDELARKLIPIIMEFENETGFRVARIENIARIETGIIKSKNRIYGIEIITNHD